MPFLDSVTSVVKRVLGTSNEATLRRLWPIAHEVQALEAEMQRLGDVELRERSARLRAEVLGGASLDSVMARAFALAREAADRRIGMWNAIDPRAASRTLFPEEAWGSAAGEIAQVRERLAAGTPAWDLDLSAAAYAAIRSRHPDSQPPFRMRAHDVQVIGACVLHQGRIAEMRTGEGKTLVASLTCYLNALSGRGVHVITVNDYLAKRDADWNGPMLRFLGVTVGAIQSQQPSFLRKQIYASDVTYGTNNEFGFDYLRDNLARSLDEQVQTRRTFAIIDEVDSVLIDEARTPLIISGPAVGRKEFYQLADSVAGQLEAETDFEIDIKDRHITLTDAGIDKAAKLFEVGNLYDSESMHLPHFLDNALKARHLYQRDKEYLVSANQVKIVDEFTGRTLEGRRWSDGLHQAIEAKEKVEIKEENQTYATITLQNFFRLYGKLAGMTGTAMTEANEFHAIYKLDVVSVPPNKRVQRNDLPDLIFGSEREKFDNIVNEVEELHAVGQPILVGTISVEISERLSELLKQKGIPHNVLNARQHQREAEIVAKAGQFAAVTIATNMAGRGTDIVLGSTRTVEAFRHWQVQGLVPKRMAPGHADLDVATLDLWCTRFLDEAVATKIRGQPPAILLREINQRRQQSGFPPLPLPSSLGDLVDVRQLGGLRIIGTERHESRRIDNQLRGRSGRQGDPGSSRFYLSLDDDLMKRFAGPMVANLLRNMGLKDGIPLESRMVSSKVEKAQKKVEEYHYGVRKNLLEYDQVANNQRTLIYRQRQQIIEGKDLEQLMVGLYRKAIDDAIQKTAADGVRGDELARRIAAVLDKDFALPIADPAILPVRSGGDACVEFGMTMVREKLAQKRSEMGEVIEHVMRFVLLDTIDRRWKDHLYAMDHLRHAISLESYAQKDPRLRFKEEGYRLFMMMNELIQQDIAKVFFRLKVEAPADAAAATPAASFNAMGFRPVGALAASGAAGAAVGPLAAAAPVQAAPAVLVASAAAGFSRPTVAVSSLGGVGGAPRPAATDPCPCGSGRPFKNCHGT